jgi:hypothetical protein
MQRDREREQSLREQGIDVAGIVTRTWMGGSSKSRVPMVSYRFTAGGREVRGESSLDRDLWMKIYEGNSLPIRYLPGRPEINRPVSGAPGPMVEWMVWSMVAPIVLPLFLFGWMIRRQSRLLAEGTPAAGVANQVLRMRGTVVVYQFQLLSGETMWGRSSVRRECAPEQGGLVCVLYDPENPGRNAMYPLALVRLEAD